MAKVLWTLFCLGLSFTTLASAINVDFCAEQKNDVLLAHPADCSKFIVCSNGATEKIMSCPTNLHFNRLSGACDYKEYAGCDRKYVTLGSRAISDDECAACCEAGACGASSPAPCVPETPAPGTPAPGTPAPGTPAPGTPAPGTPAPGTPAPGTPAPGTPAPGTPAPGTPAPGTPAPGTPAPGTPAPGTPAPGTPAPGTPAPGTPAPGTPAPGTPAPGTPAPGTPAPGTPAPGTPAPGTPAPGTPAPGTPAPGTPAPGTPAPGTPAPGTPAPGTPAPGTPAPGTPAPGTPAPGTPAPGTPAPGTPAPGEKCPDGSTVCDNTDAGKWVDGNCNEFVVCSNGCTTQFKCPNNLQYNPDTDQCDYPQNVSCPWESTPPSGPSAGPSGTSCIQPGKCLGKPDGTMLASDSNSNGYIVCQCECEIEMNCPAGTSFSTVSNTCDSAGVPVQCPDGLVYNSTIDQCDWPAGGSGGNAVQCPDGLVYNSTIDQCDWPAGGSGGNAVVCNNDVTLCKTEPEGTLLPVEGACNKFYTCAYGCAVETACPNNLIYNKNTEHCDYPQNYNCPWPYTPPSGPSAGPSGTSCIQPGKCLGKADGTMLASDSNSNGYVVCQCECEIEMNCPAGTTYDATINGCNF